MWLIFILFLFSCFSFFSYYDRNIEGRTIIKPITLACLAVLRWSPIPCLLSSNVKVSYQAIITSPFLSSFNFFLSPLVFFLSNTGINFFIVNNCNCVCVLPNALFSLFFRHWSQTENTTQLSRDKAQSVFRLEIGLFNLFKKMYNIK